jgi:hypothetical protein
MLRSAFHKSDKEVRTPHLLKVGVILTGFLYLHGLSSQLELRHRAAMYADPARWGVALALNVFGCVLAVALWNMKRWAALGLLLLALGGIALTSNIATHPLAVAALRLIPLIPAAYYWKRLTWT